MTFEVDCLHERTLWSSESGCGSCLEIVQEPRAIGHNARSPHRSEACLIKIWASFALCISEIGSVRKVEGAKAGTCLDHVNPRRTFSS